MFVKWFYRNWLDIVKCGVFLGFFWVTLAISFLAGTNRVNLFSIGYLVGSFIFLWQGAEFYLRPMHTILKWLERTKYNWTEKYINSFYTFLQVEIFDWIQCSGNCEQNISSDTRLHFHTRFNECLLDCSIVRNELHSKVQQRHRRLWQHI